MKKEEKLKFNYVFKLKVVKKKFKVKGILLISLLKIVIYKNYKYKIILVVDWEWIFKMLESFGYKVVYIVGVKDKSIYKDFMEYFKKYGVDNILLYKIKGKVVVEMFVLVVYWEKFWYNGKVF